MRFDEVDKDIEAASSRPVRADAQRNVDALLRAALAVFDEAGVDAPMREIAARAGVGVATLYRHFPKRSDLIQAILHREVEACVNAATAFREDRPPVHALASWMERLVDLVATKRGLGPALHSGDPAYQSLPDYVVGRLTPTLRELLDAAEATGAIHIGVDARELLFACLRLATPASEGDVAQARRMIALLASGLRFGMGRPESASGG